MRPLAALGFVAVAGAACSYPVVVGDLPAHAVPPPPARLAATFGLFVDATGVPDKVMVHDSLDSPVCGFMRYPLTAREAVEQSVVEAIGAVVREVRLLGIPVHRWSLRENDLDATLVIEVEKFEINLSPSRTVTGASFEADSRIELSVVATTGIGPELRTALHGAATWTAMDRWGFHGCGRGALPAIRAAERAIQITMRQLAEWVANTPELCPPPDHTLHSPVVKPPRCQQPGGTP